MSADYGALVCKYTNAITNALSPEAMPNAEQEVPMLLSEFAREVAIAATLPPGTVAVPYEMIDDALTLLEGWIERYCKPRFKEAHLRDLEKKRLVLTISPRAKAAA